MSGDLNPYEPSAQQQQPQIQASMYVLLTKVSVCIAGIVVVLGIASLVFADASVDRAGAILCLGVSLVAALCGGGALLNFNLRAVCGRIFLAVHILVGVTAVAALSMAFPEWIKTLGLFDGIVSGLSVLCLAYSVAYFWSWRTRKSPGRDVVFDRSE